VDKDIKQILEIIMGRFDKMDQRLDKVDQRLDKMDQRLDKMDQRLDKMDQRLDKVDKRLDNLEKELYEFRVEMKEEIRGIDIKIDLIYNKLDSEIKEIKSKPEPRFKIIREQ